jgi:hypothetical protein
MSVEKMQGRVTGAYLSTLVPGYIFKRGKRCLLNGVKKGAIAILL